MLESAESEHRRLTVREIIFEYFQRLCDHDTQCYGETERQTICRKIPLDATQRAVKIKHKLSLA